MTDLLTDTHTAEMTRAEAIARGSLRDVTADARNFGILLPTAITDGPGNRPSPGRTSTLRLAGRLAAPGLSWPTLPAHSCALRPADATVSSCSTSFRRRRSTEKTCSPSPSTSAPVTQESPS